MVSDYTWYPDTYDDYLYITHDEEGEVKITKERKVSKEKKDIVAFLEVKESGHYKPIGTAFSLHYEESNLQFAYLITCYHVVKSAIESKKQLFLRMNYLDEMGVDHVPLPLNWKWIVHPDNKGKKTDLVDLAVMEIKPIGRPKRSVTGSLPMDISLAKRSFVKSLKTEKEIVFMGLFEAYAGHARNYPLTRSGKIALITTEQVWGAENWLGLSDYIFVECQAYPGMSGSPVFTKGRHPETDEEIYLIVGIMAGYYPEDKTVTPFTHYGISLMIPSDKLTDILYGEEIVKNREEAMRDEMKKNRPLPATSKETEDDVFTQEDMDEALKKAFKPQDEEQTSDEEKS